MMKIFYLSRGNAAQQNTQQNARERERARDSPRLQYQRFLRRPAEASWGSHNLPSIGGEVRVGPSTV